MHHLVPTVTLLVAMANSVLSDSHRQFTIWTVDNNGGFDYAADTRGYTYAVMAEFDAPRWSLRGAEALMPTVANGITLDTNLSRARGENVELELRPAPRSDVKAARLREPREHG